MFIIVAFHIIVVDSFLALKLWLSFTLARSLSRQTPPSAERYRDSDDEILCMHLCLSIDTLYLRQFVILILFFAPIGMVPNARGLRPPGLRKVWILRNVQGCVQGGAR